MPLYLEWAPVHVMKPAPPPDEGSDEEGGEEEGGAEEEEEEGVSRSIYCKNLSFKTSEETLKVRV